MDTRGTERVQNGEKFSHAVKREVKEDKKREKPGQSLPCLCVVKIFFSLYYLATYCYFFFIMYFFNRASCRKTDYEMDCSDSELIVKCS